MRQLGFIPVAVKSGQSKARLSRWMGYVVIIDCDNIHSSHILVFMNALLRVLGNIQE